MTLLLIGMTLGAVLAAVAWEVVFCDPLRRDNDELRLHLVRRDLRRVADRFGYLDYRLQHRGTPYIDNQDHSKAAELRVVS